MTESYLVTGGAGLLGTHIVNLLLERNGASVAIFDRIAGAFDHRVKVFIGDITDRASLKEAVKTVSVDCLFASGGCSHIAVEWCHVYHSHRGRLPPG